MTYTESKKDSNKRWYEKHKEEVKAKVKQYQKEHKEEVKEYQKQYYKEHKEEAKEYQKQYQKQYYKEHKEKPKQPVIYAYTENDNEEYVYIGSTADLKQRIKTRRSGNITCYFDSIYKERPDDFTLHIIKYLDDIEVARIEEKLLIKELQPKYNIYSK